MHNSISGKARRNISKHKDLAKLSQNVRVDKSGKMEFKTKKLVYFWLVVLELQKIFSMQPNYGRKVKLCYVNIGNFVY